LATLALALALVAATVGVFRQVSGFEFITYDDNVYVTENSQVGAGLSLTSLVWAFGLHECNWHPLTWLSLMLDVELWGLHPAGFHLVNLALHIANVLLLFFVLRRLTGCDYRSAFVAMLFAIHPLHVESVAWVAERKDVLSTLFWFLTMHAYVSYVRRPSVPRYGATLAAFATGLLCKPMLVTLPVVLLLVDFWPMGRLTRRTARRLVVEKLPFLLLSVASSMITVIAQKQGGAVARLIEYPLSVRVENAVVSTIGYLGKALWPVRLAVFYPHPGGKLPFLGVAVCGTLVVVLTVLAFRSAKSHPYATFGWLWYLVTLLPVIGMIQVGRQAMADRYTYVPLVGPFVAVCWGVPDLAPGWARRWRWALLTALGGAVVLALGLRAHAQVAYWRDSITLFEHALAVTTDNADAHSNLGRAYLARGELDLALRHGREVVRIDPSAPDGHFNLGVLLEQAGKVDEAIAAYRDAIRVAPRLASAHLNLGIVLAGQGRMEEAEQELREAVGGQPNSVAARNNLGAVLAKRGAIDESIEHFEEAVRLDPGHVNARRNLERARALRDAKSP
jgi:Flp pilus assembly protein TadD